MYLMHILYRFILVAFLGGFFLPQSALAQTLYNDYQETLRGEVTNVLEEEEQPVPGTDATTHYQKIEARILDGDRTGEIIVIDNDYLELDVGDKFYFNYLVDISGAEMYAVTNRDRRGALLSLTLIFVLAVLAFGGLQGVRSLIALALSFLAIFFILIPGLLAGWSPLVASFLVAATVLFAAIFFTHGFNRESLVAYSGTMIAVILTGLFAIFSVHLTNLSGFASDESIYLDFNTGGTLNFTALLLGAIIIGVLGVLDDIAVTQAAVVTELYQSNKNLSKKEVYRKAIRVGREHVGALVNTLVLAYTGTSLPLLLLFRLSSSNVEMLLNMELFATEIVRTIVGSIGLILTVPIVTLLAVWYLKDYTPKHAHHSHSHGHHH